MLILLVFNVTFIEIAIAKVILMLNKSCVFVPVIIFFFSKNILGSNGNSQRRHSSVDEIMRFTPTLTNRNQHQRSLSESEIEETKIKGV